MTKHLELYRVVQRDNQVTFVEVSRTVFEILPNNAGQNKIRITFLRYDVLPIRNYIYLYHMTRY